MRLLCLSLALGLTILLGYVSFVQLLYLESLRLMRRDLPSLERFRESLSAQLGLEVEQGSLVFSVIKHSSLFLIGVFYLCALMRPEASQSQSVLEAIAVSFVSMLIMSYLVPQALYRRGNAGLLASSVPFAKLLAVLAKPIAAPIRGFQALLDLNEHNGRPTTPPDATEHIEAFINAGEEEGILEEEDRQLIHSVVAFGDKDVREVMTARPNVVAISADRSLEDLRQLVIHERYSRIPVYEGSIDNPIGFVHVRDIFELDANERQAKTLKDVIRPVSLVPESKPVSELLREMQRNGSHMVIVVDEYGHVAGLATMEDVVEEILGEIRDEHEPERDVKQEADHVYIAPGSLDLDRLHDLLNFRPHDDTESTTIGGLLAEWLGHVPQVGESVERNGIRVEVLAGNERRVEEVRISRTEAAAPVGATA